MSDIIASTAHKLVKKAIDHVMKKGTEFDVWGGTIPQKISDKSSPNDFDRTMIECVPLTMTLTNPLARWSDYSDHWVGITLRETEDSLQGYNPGHVLKYSKLYHRWLNIGGYFNYTYGERLKHYIYNTKEISGKQAGMTSSFDQLEATIKLLEKHPNTRRACISTWHPVLDVGGDYVPCNMIFQMRIVNGKLQWITVIRSLDVLRGFTENIFMFTIFQEYVARRLKVPVGHYNTVALNAHLYKDMIDQGYHKQDSIPDPYDFYTPECAFEYPFPDGLFKGVDELLFKKGKFFDCMTYTSGINSQYWRNWKYALISEYNRLQGNSASALKAYNKIDNEFKFSVARRLGKIMPIVVEYLPFDKQKTYLKKVLKK